MSHDYEVIHPLISRSTHQIAKPLVGKFMSDHQCYKLFGSSWGIVRINKQQSLPAKYTKLIL